MSRPYILVASLCCFAGSSLAAEPPSRILLIGSPADDHPWGTHKYATGVEIVEKLLKPVPGVEVTGVKAEGPWAEGPDLIGRADAIVIFLTEGAKWISADPKRLAALRALAKRGGGLTCLHWGMGTRDPEPIAAFVDLFGGCHGGPDRKYAVVETSVAVPDPKHPIATGIKDFTIRDEFYFKLKFPKSNPSVTPILQAKIEGNAETVAWAWQRTDGGRSFGFSGLHFHENWKRPEYRRLIAQGVLWTAKRPIPELGLNVDLPESAYLLPAKK